MCSKTETQPATPNYSCPTDFTLSGTTCTKTYPAQPNYSCPANYTLSGTTCSMTLSLPARVTMVCPPGATEQNGTRSEEHTSELQSLMRISYAVFCLKKKKRYTQYIYTRLVLYQAMKNYKLYRYMYIISH